MKLRYLVSSGKLDSAESMTLRSRDIWDRVQMAFKQLISYISFSFGERKGKIRPKIGFHSSDLSMQ